ncbi:MAG: molybdate ABC transporter permease subunit, partial [Burkholderiaceae bacterium]
MLSSEEAGIILLSLKIAFWSVTLSLLPAFAVAYLLARTQFFGKTLVDAVVHLPLVLPPVVIGFALLTFFGKRGVIGAALYDWFGIVFA